MALFAIMSASPRNLRTTEQVFKAIQEQPENVITTLNPGEYVKFAQEQLKEAESSCPGSTTYR